MDIKRRKHICILAGAAAALMLCTSIGRTAWAELYKKGSSGPTVTEIQTRLKNWGYYSGPIDGIYGSKTEAAVRYFQRQNGLTVDGHTGDDTLAALGIQPKPGQSAPTYGDQSSELGLLARLISAEARGEPYEGQVAVGAVVLNRIEHASFPNTMSEVIYQPWAFTCINDGQFDEPVAESAYRAAQDALNGWDPSNGAIYYFNPETATSEWIWTRPLIVQIGKHRFCA